MRTRVLMAALGLVPVLAVAGYAAGNERSETRVAAAATARFHDLDAAQAAGYVVHVQELSGVTCIANGAVGAMGDHFANPGRLFDAGVLDAAEPEALVYERRDDGSFKLVALEYLVFAADWEAAGNAAAPALFGQTFDFVDSPNRYGLPPFYALHAWLWKPNPSGLLATWNPDVSCEG